MARLYTRVFGYVDSVWVMYWQDHEKTYRFNNFLNEIIKLEERYRIDHLVNQKGLDYVRANINRKTDEWQRNQHWIERHRGKKNKGDILFVINQGKEYYSLKGSHTLREIEMLFEDLEAFAY